MSATRVRVYCALLHHPVRDRAGQTVTTAVTNLDVHDIARSARTYGVRGYYVVTPIEAQHVLVRRIMEHWTSGAGRTRFPERHMALSLCHPCLTLEAAIADIEQREAVRPRLIATAARASSGRSPTSYELVRERLESSDEVFLLLFGTGHGLADTLLERADVLLEPIQPGRDYNHLSVRAAAAIIFDRLLRAR
jgi:hypothetical protein